MIANLKDTVIIVGHYGSGKTNIAANLAVKLAEHGEAVTIADLDVVNPYFRTADFKELFAENHVRLIASKYANSALDVPALGFGVTSGKPNGRLIIDVGGDDEGAKALGRYAEDLQSREFDMLYVVNKYRYLTQEPAEALGLLREIEVAAGLKCTGIINNSNLGAETTAEIIAASLPYAGEIADKAGVPLLFTAGKIKCAAVDFPVEIFVKPIWEK
ncbi:MAG: cobalamin biosynthesis protein CobQ [Oscillospiraceae bacterium]|nr:cobalamin biosynthesis protein CobQ [Oscillospiraceae bacterium]